MNFIPAVAICFQKANQKQGGALHFKVLLQDWGRKDFSKILCASLFNSYLSKELYFSRVHLAGQYL